MTLMIVVAVLRLLRISRPALIARGPGTMAGLVAGLLARRHRCSRRSARLNLVIFFVGVVAANVFAGVPIAFSFALATFGYLALTTSTPMMVMVGRMDEGMSHLILLAVPLFIFLGAADRDDRHGAGHDPVPGQPAGPRPRRTVAMC